MRMAMLLLLAIGLPMAASAQTVTIGTDTTTHYGAPISNLSKYSLAEMIFTADEIGTPSTNQVLSIGFYSDADVIQSYSINIYMKNVGRSSFSSSADYIKLTSADRVYYSQTNGKINPRAGWNTIVLPTPFDYDPDSNLLIVVDKYVGTSGYGDSVWRYTSTATATDSICKMLYSEGSSWLLPTVTSIPNLGLNYERPNIQISFDESCVVPTNLSATLTPGDDTIATLTWTTHGIANDWVLQYGTDNTFAANTYTEISSLFSVNESTVTVNLTNLTPETTYYARVKPSCDTADTLWSNVLEFIPTNAFALTAFEDGNYTNYYFPMYVHGTVPPSVCYNKSECIIPATELAEMCHGSTISAMTFYPSSVSNISWENTQHKVFLKEVTSTTLGGHYSGWNDATIVFEGQLPEPTANSETYTITFQQNYTYNGGNLLIGIYSINGASGSVTWKGVSSTEAGVSAYGTSLYSYDNVNYYEYYQSNRSFLPKTTFSYFPCDTPKPKNLTSSNITADEATLSWVIPDALTTITGYQYSYKKMNDAEWSQDYSTTTTSVTIDGLDEQTRYQFRVRACYGDLGQSDYTTTNFTTALQAESFTFADVTTGGSSTPFLGNRVNYGTHGQFIIPATSLVDIAGSDIRRLSFYISTGTLTQTTDWGGAQFEVWIAEVDNTTFSSNALYPWEDMTLVFSCDTLRAIDGVMHIDLDPYYSYGGHNLLIGFKQIVLGTSESINWCGEYGHSNAAVVSYKTSATSLTTISRSNYLPKTTIYYQATDYPRILDIYTDTITSTTAQLSWMAPSPNVTGYRYQYKLSSVSDWTTAWESLSASSTSVMLESLLPASDYDFRIKVIYGEQESIVTTTSFTTAEVLPSCITPSQLGVTTNALSATLTWVSEAPTCQVAHSIYASSNPQYNIAGTTTDSTYTLDNLTIDKDHYFWVRGICGNNDYSEWAGPISIHIGYCEANPTQRSNKGIVGVAFGNGDYTVNNYNANGLPARCPYYGNYTNMVGAIQAGVQDTIKITTNTSFYDNSYWIRIWVDFNNNLIFDDDENIYRGWAWDYGEGTINAIITIPATQAAGDYRMRIGGCEYLQNENDPCLTGYLQAGYNDYTLRVLEMPVFTKDIAGHGGNNGGYYLIASPIVDAIMPSEENGFITDTYDLYRFNPSHEDNEWENYKTFTNGYEIENGKGYLYASHDSTTLIFTGSPYNDNGEVILVYDATDERKCWNLVGNPFICEAILDREYYVLNDDGKTINPNAMPATTPIPPFTAVFVKAVSIGDRVIFTKVVP